MGVDAMALRSLDRAAALLRDADAVLLAIGRSLQDVGGLAAPSGAPPRGWGGRSPRRGLPPEDLAHPRWFERAPTRAWAYYGRRLALARGTAPPLAFALLTALLGERPWFAITTGVDGRAQQGGLDAARFYELQGSLHHLQRVDGRGEVWSAAGVEVEVVEDPAEGWLATGALPSCPHTWAPARPNVLMANDWRWREERSAAQAAEYRRWLSQHQAGRIVVLELDARTSPDLRRECERRHVRDSTLVRVDAADARIPAGGLHLPLAAEAALAELLDRLAG